MNMHVEYPSGFIVRGMQTMTPKVVASATPQRVRLSTNWTRLNLVAVQHLNLPHSNYEYRMNPQAAARVKQFPLSNEPEIVDRFPMLND